jgi:hypothetical protein
MVPVTQRDRTGAMAITFSHMLPHSRMFTLAPWNHFGLHVWMEGRPFPTGTLAETAEERVLSQRADGAVDRTPEKVRLR